MQAQGIQDPARRDVLKGATAAAGIAAAGPANANDRVWEAVRSNYALAGDVLNLNNAGVSPQPLSVQEFVIRAYRFANQLPDVNMWEILDATRERTKGKLAALVDCSPAEIALNRNATEGLCTIIHGIDLARDDEVVVSAWDYESMRHAWDQRARRHGIRVRVVDFSATAPDEVILAAYVAALGPRTRVLHLTHMLHFTGRILPLQELCAIAHERGIRTIVDAAQSFAQVPVSFRSMGCDYLAVSLHKWLCAPFGTGMLIVRQDRIDELWPLLAPYDAAPTGIAKIDGWNLGTYSSPAEHAIGAAIDEHTKIGPDKIHARLAFLTRHWTGRARLIKGLTMATPLAPGRHGAVATFCLAGWASEEVEKRLRGEHRIRVRARRRGEWHGVRVSPHVYTSVDELDRFIDALEVVARS